MHYCICSLVELFDLQQRGTREKYSSRNCHQEFNDGTPASGSGLLIVRPRQRESHSTLIAHVNTFNTDLV